MKDKTHTSRFIQYYMAMAYVSAGMSTAKRLQVGCVIVDDTNNIAATGYNGTLPGADNNCEHVVDGILRTNHDLVIHAEDNALRRMKERQLPTEGCTLFVTQSPCSICAEKIIAAGIDYVYYLNQHRDAGGLKKLTNAFISVTRVPALDIPVPRLTESFEPK